MGQEVRKMMGGLELGGLIGHRDNLGFSLSLRILIPLFLLPGLLIPQNFTQKIYSHPHP